MVDYPQAQPKVLDRLAKQRGHWPERRRTKADIRGPYCSLHERKYSASDGMLSKACPDRAVLLCLGHYCVVAEALGRRRKSQLLSSQISVSPLYKEFQVSGAHVLAHTPCTYLMSKKGTRGQNPSE